MWVTGERQRLPHVSSQELITQKDDSSPAEMTLEKTRGFQSRVAQGSACRLQRQTYTTEARAQPPDRNVTESTWNEVTAGAVMKMIRPPKRSNSVRSWGSVQGRVSSHQHRLPSKRVFVFWEPCLGSCADERISPWHCGSACRWPWCCTVIADTQTQSCSTPKWVPSYLQLLVAPPSPGT